MNTEPCGHEKKENISIDIYPKLGEKNFVKDMIEVICMELEKKHLIMFYMIFNWDVENRFSFTIYLNKENKHHICRFFSFVIRGIEGIDNVIEKWDIGEFKG